MIPELLAVAAGGAIGAALRYLTGFAALHLFGPSRIFTGTLIVNILGCLLAGFISGWFILTGPEMSKWSLFLLTGILGSYTTFSTFALDTLLLARNNLKKTTLYLFLHILVAVSAFLLGTFLYHVITDGGLL